VRYGHLARSGAQHCYQERRQPHRRLRVVGSGTRTSPRGAASPAGRVELPRPAGTAPIGACPPPDAARQRVDAPEAGADRVPAGPAVATMSQVLVPDPCVAAPADRPGLGCCRLTRREILVNPPERPLTGGTSSHVNSRCPATAAVQINRFGFDPIVLLGLGTSPARMEHDAARSPMVTERYQQAASVGGRYSDEGDCGLGRVREFAACEGRRRPDVRQRPHDLMSTD
jgi:hypothetical protein